MSAKENSATKMAKASVAEGSSQDRNPLRWHARRRSIRRPSAAVTGLPEAPNDERGDGKTSERAGRRSPAIRQSPVPNLSKLPPPCFHWRKCGEQASLEKQGKSLCRQCAARYPGTEYPLRSGRQSPLS